MQVQSPPRPWKPLLLPVLALTAGAHWLGDSLAEEPVLLASPLGSLDLDDDGLVDVQESILNTDAFQADSDGDGFSDLEEFTRGTDPMDFDDQPLGSDAAIAMTGRAQAGVFRAVTALYVPGGDVTGATLTFGALVAGNMIPIDPMMLFTGASLTVHPGVGGSGEIFLLETPMPESLVLALGNTALYMAYAPAGAGAVTHAAALNLTSINGVVTQVVGGSSGSGTTYRPLMDDPDIPVTWTPAMVCVQTLHTVGVVGAVLQQEVDSAQCETVVADSYCPPDCVNLTGTIQEMIDPLALIGG